LQELVIQRRQASLLGLLAERTGPDLRLTSTEKVLLGLSAQSGQGGASAGSLRVSLLADPSEALSRTGTLSVLLLSEGCQLLGICRALPKQLLAQTRLSLTRAKLLPILLLAQTLKRLTGTQTLPIKLLPQGRLLLSCAHALRVALLADVCQLLTASHLTGQIGLLRAQINALLLLRGRKRLPVSLIEKTRKQVAGGKVLLALKRRRRDTRAVATKCALTNGIAGLARHRLLILLVLESRSLAHHILQIWRHILVNGTGVELARINSLRASRSHARCHLVKGLSTRQSLTNATLSLALQGLGCTHSSSVKPASNLIVALSTGKRAANVLRGLRLHRRGSHIAAHKGPQRLPRILPAGVLGVQILLRCGLVVPRASIGSAHNRLGSGLKIRLGRIYGLIYSVNASILLLV
jgi:hypothetical protein